MKRLFSLTTGRPDINRQQHLLVGVFLLVCALSVLAIVTFESIDSALITASLTIAAAAFVLLPMGPETDILHPVRVFGGLWCLCLALSSLHLSAVNSEWDVEMWTLMIGALVAFIGAFWISHGTFVKMTRFRTAANRAEAWSRQILSPHRALILASISLIIGIVAFAYRYRTVGEIPILAPAIDETTNSFFSTAGYWARPELDTIPNKIIGLLCLFCRYAAYLSCIVLLQRSEKTRTQKIWAASVILAGLAALASQGGRGFLAEFTMVSLVLFQHLRRQIRLKELVSMALIVMLFLSFAGYFRATSGGSERAYKLAQEISLLPEGFVWDNLLFGYFSVTAPMETFFRLTKDLQSFRESSPGYMFYFIHRFVPRENIAEIATALYGGEMMAPTFLGEFYADLGFAGVILGPFILGLGYSYVYARVGRRDSLYWICILAVLMELLMYFPHINFFFRNVNWILDIGAMCVLIAMAGAGKLSTARSASELRRPVLAISRS
jgi:oligosaccharide repeat unit polymerase